MNEPAQVTPDGTAFAGEPWTEQVILPTHYKNPDGTDGAVIDWSTSTLTVQSQQTADIALAWDLTTRTATLTLTAPQVTAIPHSSFRWYLLEAGLFNAPLLWRRVKIGKVS